MNRVCHHILKIILLHAGIRPVTFSLVCKRWRQIVRGLTLEEKWSYQLQKAREAGVFLADKFSFENLRGLERISSQTSQLLLYFAHKLIRKDDKTYTYDGDFTVTFTGNYDVIVDGPIFTYFTASQGFKSLMHYKNFAGTIVYDLTCFRGQYQWTGDVMMTQTSPTYINAMIPNGCGFATINGRTFEVYASYGVLLWDYPTTSNMIYPDMTANLNL